MRVHVVISTRERTRLLRRTLESLAGVARPEGFERVLVVENGARAGTELVVQDFASRLPVEYAFVPRAGKSGAMQAGLERLRTGLVVFFDDDVRFVPEILDAYAAAARGCGPRAFFGGPFGIDYDRPPPAWLLPFLPLSARGSTDPEPGGHFVGFNFAARAEDLLAVGGFDLTLGTGAPGNPVGEEWEMQERLLASGVRSVFVPGAKVWHYVPPERCSPAWTLIRTYRHHLTATLLSDREDPSPRSFGAPRWLWRDVARAAARALGGELRRDPVERFVKRNDLMKALGDVAGAREASRARASASRGREM